MTCLEHLIENQLARFEEHPEKTYEQYIDDIKSDINFEDAGITAEQCYEITQYVLYSYCSNCPSKHQDKRNNGKWEEEMIDDFAIERWQSARCSVCGLYHTTPYMYYFSRYNYCPHCGAEMRKEKTDANNGA